MPVSIEWLTDATFPMFREFAEQVWDRPRADHFYAWRYRDAPRHQVAIAHDNRRCLAAISVFRRPYLLGGRQVECLETCDWFSLPQLRGAGLGVRVMLKVMDLGVPIVSLGGTEDTVHLLPRLGFCPVATGYYFTLPFSGDAVRAAAGPGVRARASALLVSGALDVLASATTLMRRPSSVRVACSSSRDGGPLPQPAINEPDDADLRSVVYTPHLDWLASRDTPAGEFLSFALIEDDCALASATARVYRHQGVLVSALLDLRWSRAVSERLGDLVQAITDELRARGAQSVLAVTTCNRTAAAFRAAGFIRRSAAPAFIRPGGQSIAAGAVRLSAMRGDGGLLPLPTAVEARAAAL